MRILICGSRDFTDYDKLKKEVLNALPIGDYRDCVVISGHARGADTLGEKLAEEMEWKCEMYPADWSNYGRRAGPIRNRQMLVEGKPDMVIAFKSETSKGTVNMINQAVKANVPTVVIQIPSRIQLEGRTEV